jgi:hypothetical protein
MHRQYHSISTLSHSYMFRHQRLHLQAVQYEPGELLPNVLKAEWDEGCILQNNLLYYLVVNGGSFPYIRVGLQTCLP